MSADPDRISVPTNGRGPHPIPDLTASPALPSEPSLSGPTKEEMSVAFSPKQAAIGFGILASLLLLVVGWARRGRSGD